MLYTSSKKLITQATKVIPISISPVKYALSLKLCLMNFEMSRKGCS